MLKVFINRYFRYLFLFIFSLCLFACSEDEQFYAYRREFIGEAAIGSAVTKKIILQNESLTEVKHISGLDFESGTNSDGHFRIDKVEVGGVAQNPKNKDISVPAGSIVQIYVTYQPLKMDTSVAEYGGWSTGKPEGFVPHDPKLDEKPKDESKGAIKSMKTMLGKADEGTVEEPVAEETEAVETEPSPEALPTAIPNKLGIHRAVFVAVYDLPQMGTVQVEVFGTSVPGPNGELSTIGGGNVECPATAGILCYKGGFAMELPELMSSGAKQLNMGGPVIFNASGNNVTLDMASFPAELLVLKGNGPGEPLEGKPINAVSIVISGTEGVKATGTFDGSKLTVNGVSFRIRVALGEITEADINPGLQAATDFNVKDLQITTTKPYTNGAITLTVETQLSKTPSGNAMFDQFLGGATVRVTMDGNLNIQ